MDKTGLLWEGKGREGRQKCGTTDTLTEDCGWENGGLPGGEGDFPDAEGGFSGNQRLCWGHTDGRKGRRASNGAGLGSQKEKVEGNSLDIIS